MSWVENYKKVMARLSEEQCMVVADLRDKYNKTQAPLRVIACAGSGKTATVVAGLAFLVNEQIANPTDIVLTTFTKKAAEEMSGRLNAITAPGVVGYGGVSVSTYHSLARQTVRRLAKDGGRWEFLRKPHYYSMALCLEIRGGLKGRLETAQKERKHYQTPAEEQIKRVADVSMNNLWEAIAMRGQIPGLPDHIKSVSEQFGGISVDAKSLGLSVELYRSQGYTAPAQAAEKAGLDKSSTTFLGWELFNAAKKSLGMWDFADVLQAYYDAAVAGGDRAKLFIVDEAQDNTAIQMAIARTVAKNGQGRAVYVGDIRQSIYSFRGAAPEILGNADKTEKATTLELTTNYRSGGAIVAAGNSVADGQDWSVGSPARAGRPSEGKVEYMTAMTGGQRADQIAERFEQLIKAGTHKPKDLAILTRAKSALAHISIAFGKRQIPIRVQGGSQFFDAVPVDRVMQYIRLANGYGTPAQRVDDFKTSFKTIMPHQWAKFRRNDTFSQLHTSFTAGGRPFLSGARRWFAEESSKYSNRDLLWVKKGDSSVTTDELDDRFQDYMDVIEAAEAGPDAPAAPVVAALAELLAKARVLALPQFLGEDESGPTTSEEGDGDPDMIAALIEVAESMTVSELARFSLQESDEAQQAVAEGGQTTQGEAAASVEASEDRVTACTIHASKGLEWPVVALLCGPRELPLMGEDTPEERRLFYVGVTRAEDLLILATPQGSFSVYVDPTRPKGGPETSLPENEVEVEVEDASPVVSVEPAVSVEQLDPHMQDYLTLRRLFETKHPELLSTFDEMREDVLRHMELIRRDVESRVRAEVEAKTKAEETPDASSSSEEETPTPADAGGLRVSFSDALLNYLYEHEVTVFDGQTSADPDRAAVVRLLEDMDPKASSIVLRTMAAVRGLRAVLTFEGMTTAVDDMIRNRREDLAEANRALSMDPSNAKLDQERRAVATELEQLRGIRSERQVILDTLDLFEKKLVEEQPKKAEATAAGLYLTRSGKVGAEITQEADGRYRWTGEWGAGSGHDRAAMEQILRETLNGRRGVQTVVDFFMTRDPFDHIQVQPALTSGPAAPVLVPATTWVSYTPTGEGCYAEAVTTGLVSQALPRGKPVRLAALTPLLCTSRSNGYQYGYVSSDGFILVRSWSDSKIAMDEAKGLRVNLTAKLAATLPAQLSSDGGMMLLYSLTGGEPFKVAASRLVGVNPELFLTTPMSEGIKRALGLSVLVQDKSTGEFSWKL